MKKIIIIFTVIFLSLAAGLFFYLWQNNNVVGLYYLNSDNTGLVRDVRDNTSKTLEGIVNALLDGPYSPEMNLAIQRGTKLISAELIGNDAIINFSKEFGPPDGVRAIWSRLTVLQTLCELNNIRRVKILVEGNPMKDANGNEISFLTKDDIVVDSNANLNDCKFPVSLYYLAENGEQLSTEKRTIVQNSREAIEKTVLNELLKGPTDKNAKRIIPQETKLLSIETKESVCFVNLSEDFAQHFQKQDSKKEILAIYSIVNTLTSLPKIQKVKILINGNVTPKSLPDNDPLSFNKNPFEN